MPRLDMPDQKTPSRRLAYGVDPNRPERYSLRQARYDALAHDVDALAGVAVRQGRRLAVLDIGSGVGSTPLHLRARPNFSAIDIDGTDVERKSDLDASLYRRLIIGDLGKGYPELASGAYDVVICEQVLEHIVDLKIPMETIARLVKPGGRAFVGVPIFPPPLHLARRHIVPRLDRLTGLQRRRDHVQAFTLANFKAQLIANSRLQFVEARGFRFISGGVLRPLEELRGWWSLNRWLGARLPSACIEVQVVMQKPALEATAAA